MNILYIEDEITHRHLYTTSFRLAGFKVKAVKDGSKAILALEEEIPDLIVSDLIMPSFNGKEFQSWLRSKEKYMDIQLVFLTNLDKDNCILDRRTQYISKLGTTPKEVVQKIKDIYNTTMNNYE